MSLTNSLEVGDLVYVQKSENSALGPLDPIKESGIGIILKIKPTKIFKENATEKTELYKILINGKTLELLRESINKVTLDI